MRGVARACCQAAATLHKVGIVHSDFRMANVVRLDDCHWMVIDLEHCRRAADPLPDGYKLADWDEGTTEKKKRKRYYSPASDMYQIGRLLKPLLKEGFSGDAHAFVSGLSEKSLDAAAALKHTWLSLHA